MTPPDPVTAAVAALAVYRLTILVTADTILDPARSWLVHRLNVRKHGQQPGTDRPGARNDWLNATYRDPHWLAYLLGCPWCASPYLALPVVAGAVWWPSSPVWWLVCGTLAASGVAAMLASRVTPS